MGARLDAVRHLVRLDHPLRRKGPHDHHGSRAHGLLQKQRRIQLLPLRDRVRNFFFRLWGVVNRGITLKDLSGLAVCLLRVEVRAIMTICSETGRVT